MQERNKVLFFILVLIVLVIMFFMRFNDDHGTKANPGHKAMSVEAAAPR